MTTEKKNVHNSTIYWIELVMIMIVFSSFIFADINDQSTSSSNEIFDASSIHPPTHEIQPPPDIDLNKSLDLDTLVNVEYIKPTKIFATLHNDDILFYESKIKTDSSGLTAGKCK
jgi:hypothetical protein